MKTVQRDYGLRVTFVINEEESPAITADDLDKAVDHRMKMFAEDVEIHLAVHRDIDADVTAIAAPVLGQVV